jgi:hypothetical protein
MILHEFMFKYGKKWLKRKQPIYAVVFSIF